MKAKIWNNNFWTEQTEPKELKQKFEEVLKQCGFNILAIEEHYFHPQGYTALFLLAESHLAIHTFPECGKTYIELSSCNLDYYIKFLKLTENLK